MKLVKFFNNLIKTIFTLLLFMSIIFKSNPIYALDIPMNQRNLSITEELRINVPKKYRETWLKAEREIWDPWLSKQDGYLGRKIFYNESKGEALLLVNWESRELWKNITDKEVNKIQKIYEETIINSLGIETYPFEFIYEGELFEQL